MSGVLLGSSGIPIIGAAKPNEPAPDTTDTPHGVPEVFMSTGLVLKAALGGDRFPVIQFEFQDASGRKYPPIALVLDDESMAEIGPYVRKAVGAAIRLSRAAAEKRMEETIASERIERALAAEEAEQTGPWTHTIEPVFEPEVAG